MFRLVANFYMHLACFFRPNGYDELLLSCDRRQGGHMTSEDWRSVRDARESLPPIKTYRLGKVTKNA